MDRINLTLTETEPLVAPLGLHSPCCNSQETYPTQVVRGPCANVQGESLKAYGAELQQQVQPPDSYGIPWEGEALMPAAVVHSFGNNVVNLFNNRDKTVVSGIEPIPPPIPALRNWHDAPADAGQRFSIDEIGPPTGGMVSFEATVPSEILQSVLLLLSVPGSHIKSDNGKLVCVSRDGIAIIQLAEQETEFT